jgi:TolB protein
MDNSGIFRMRELTDSLQVNPATLFENWESAGASYLISAEEERVNGGSVKIKVIDLRTSLNALEAEYRINPRQPWRTSNVIVDDIIALFNGLRGSMSSQIAYIQKRDSGNEITVVDADGRNTRQLTYSNTLNMSPDWSPDYNSIVYGSLGGNQWGINFLDIDTSRITRFSQPGMNTTPCFNPNDPDQIAFTSFRDGNAEIYTCRTNGRGLRRLTNNPRIDTSPVWSPDGKKIAFVSDRTGNPCIYVMNSDGSDQHRLTMIPNSYEDSPDWSPRGDLIVFVVRNERGNFDIATSSTNGDNVIILTGESGSNEDPSWSPDGLRIAFTSSRSGAKRIYLIGWDGSNLVQLTREINNFSPVWSPSASGDDLRIKSGR